MKTNLDADKFIREEFGLSALELMVVKKMSGKNHEDRDVVSVIIENFNFSQEQAESIVNDMRLKMLLLLGKDTKGAKLMRKLIAIIHKNEHGDDNNDNSI